MINLIKKENKIKVCRYVQKIYMETKFTKTHKPHICCMNKLNISHKEKRENKNLKLTTK